MVGRDRSSAAGAFADWRIGRRETAALQFGPDDPFARFRVLEQLA
jgi:hypothetical protein